MAERCLQWGIAISIENPGNSLFWKIPFVLSFLNRVQGFDAVFHHCAHGGLRDKLTRWWASVDWFLSLAILCDKSHYHAPWNPTVKGGKLAFPTHKEAASPILLCTRLADIAFQKALEMGAVQLLDLPQQVASTNTTSQRFLLDMLPKGKKFRPLVSEYGLVATAAVKSQPSLPLQSFPKGAKVVHRRLHQGKVRVDQESRLKDPLENSGEEGHLTVGYIIDGPEDGFSWEVCSVGIPREPVDFIKAAFKAGHPRTMAIHLADGIKQVLLENFREEQFELSKKRLDFIRKWSNRARELNDDEAKYHYSLPKHLQVILKGKRLLLLKEILQEIDYPDRDLVKHISGWLPKSGIFPPELRRPEHDIETVKIMARGLNKMIVSQLEKQDDDELAKRAWASTMEEIDMQWVWLDDTSEVGNFLLAKRFPLEQKQKLRIIDDCTAGGLNQTCGSQEKLKIHAIDELIAYLSWSIAHYGDPLVAKLVGKTFDLTSAYKQYGISEADRELLRIATWDPHQRRVRLLGVNALPFGATGSVGSFLRVGMAIWFVGFYCLRLVWTCYFDDYTLVSRVESSKNADFAAEALFQLLGVAYAREGKKRTEFGRQVRTALFGRVVGLHRSWTHS